MTTDRAGEGRSEFSRAPSFGTNHPTRYNGWVVRIWDEDPFAFDGYAFSTREEAERFAAGFDRHSIVPSIVRLEVDTEWNEKLKEVRG